MSEKWTHQFEPFSADPVDGATQIESTWQSSASSIGPSVSSVITEKFIEIGATRPWDLSKLRGHVPCSKPYPEYGRSVGCPVPDDSKMILLRMANAEREPSSTSLDPWLRKGPGQDWMAQESKNLGTSAASTARLLSTNAMPPYRPLSPSSSSFEEGESDMDQVKMTRRKRHRRLKLGRGDDEDAEEGQGGQGGEGPTDLHHSESGGNAGSGRYIYLLDQ
ncbi:hypothetical protein DFH09DRAFT_1077883 [Mycena vulgaris]|nr:hypothetical protein DFH09DRAFT_1077883 [Mycena vulgaris]